MKINTLIKNSIFIPLMFSTMSIVAQTGIDSPYTRFGLGQLENRSNGARFQAMGGISNALSGNRFINPSNPASYAGFDSLSFIFNAGLNATSVTYRTTTQSEEGSNATISYITMGFPLSRWWRTSVGLLPYSQVGYSIKVPFSIDNVGNLYKVFEGEGGLNQVYWGNAFILHKKLSVGINSTYVFGKNTNSILVYSPDSAYYANTKIENKLQVNDFIFDYGVLFKHEISEKLNLNIGLTYSQKINLNVKRDYLARVCVWWCRWWCGLYTRHD